MKTKRKQMCPKTRQHALKIGKARQRIRPWTATSASWDSRERDSIAGKDPPKKHQRQRQCHRGAAIRISRTHQDGAPAEANAARTTLDGRLGNCIDIDSVAVVQHKLVHRIVGGKMSPPVLYYLPPSPPCRSILLLAKMLDLDFELKIVNILEGEQLKPDFVAMNPQHCVPTMNDEGLVLWESRAILAYLVAAYGKSDALYPTDIRVRALVDQRLHFDLGTLYMRLTDYYFPTMFIGAPLDEGKRAKLTEAVGWLNSILEGRQYAAAEHFTIADLTLLVTVSQLEAFEFELRPYKHIRQWLDRCKDHMAPFGYEEINVTKANLLADMFKAKMNQSGGS